MIVIARTSVKRLVEKGAVDVWSPRGDNAPRGNIIHVVRTRSTGDTFCHAKLTQHREGVLQDITALEVASAGFKRRDDFYAYWAKRHATSPHMASPVLCWVSTYERVDVEIPQFMAHPVAGRSGDYVRDARHAIDDLEVMRDERCLSRWATLADEQRKAARRLEWRGARRAA